MPNIEDVDPQQVPCGSRQEEAEDEGESERNTLLHLSDPLVRSHFEVGPISLFRVQDLLVGSSLVLVVELFHEFEVLGRGRGLLQNLYCQF